MRINNNIMALNTHRQYNIANNSVSSSAEKLSSGYRINRAGDDAAGLAISEKMRAQIRGLNMASKNSQDAISLVQTAEGALQETHNILQRMRELAVQSGSDTNETVIDRGALQQEFEALQAEIDDIASKTRFNDQNLIDGTFQKYTKQVVTGTTANGWTGILVDNAQAGKYAFSATGVKQVAATQNAGSAPALVAPPTGYTALNAASGTGTTGKNIVGTTITATFTPAATAENNGMLYTLDIQGSSATDATLLMRDTDGNIVSQVNNFDLTQLNGKATGTIDINFAGVGKLSFTAAANTAMNITDDAAGLQAWKNSFLGHAVYFDNAGVSATASAATPGYMSLTIGSETVQVGLGETSATFKESGITLQFQAITDSDINNGSTPTKFKNGDIVIGVNSGKSLIVQTGANEGDNLGINIDAMNTATLGISFSNIATQKSASKAITEVNSAINQVSTQRAALGALQNRLSHKIANLDTSAENLQAAESRIRDIDMAKEMSEFTKKNILVQAATAMLAQANQAPQNVLSLLR